MPFRIKLAAAGLAVSLVVIASWANSDRVYTWYSRFWHVTVRGETPFSALQDVREERKRFDNEKTKIANRSVREDFIHDFDGTFSRHLDMMIRVHVPQSVPQAQMTEDEKELCRYAGLWYLEKKEILKGCRLILRTVGTQVGRDEIVPYTNALDALFEEKMYSDLVFETAERRFDPADEGYPLRIGVYYRYGVSLYHIKRYKEALVQLQNAVNAGYPEDDLSYYMAESYRELRRVKEAIPWAEKAFAAAPRDRRFRALLVSLYNADGRRRDAERASRGN